MSDPYGNNPYGQNPGGQTPGGQPNPYGASGGGAYPPPPGGGYGGGHSGGSDPLPPKTDGLSIAALVVSFLCVCAPIGVILGFVGLKRTKGGQRKGRGLAIAAIIVGILMTLATGAAIAGIAIFADKVVTPGKAEVGQCVNIDQDEDDNVIMYKKDCTEEHDGEIVAVAEVDAENKDAIASDMSNHCGTIVSDEDIAKLNEFSDDLEYKAVIEDPENVETGDHLVCYVESNDKLDKPIL
ncbi:MAG: DUF4190 domain-containing protein [Propionibacteriales bacterium]|nr:DUF4190 domain-containing protein [Propionibacteriales bacterium]